MSKKQSGFTIIELLFVAVIFIVAGIFVVIQKNNIQVINNDKQRKTAINAIYYSLEEVYYPRHGYYPQNISETILPSVDPDLFTDPNGKKINTSGSDYTYKPLKCQEEKCQKYTLTSDLQNEADYTKTNRQKD